MTTTNDVIAYLNTHKKTVLIVAWCLVGFCVLRAVFDFMGSGNIVSAALDLATAIILAWLLYSLKAPVSEPIV